MSPHPTAVPDIVTYRLDKNMVYVPPPSDIHKAIEIAQSVFPELSSIDRSRITFSVNVISGGKTTHVQISSFAWEAIMKHLTQYEIIDLHVRAEPLVDAPPEYHLQDLKNERAPSSTASRSHRWPFGGQYKGLFTGTCAPTPGRGH